MQQGNHLSEPEIRKIISLLENTELGLSDIALRMGCSRSAITSINRRFQVRNYSGRRATWTVRKNGSSEFEELLLVSNSLGNSGGHRDSASN